MQYDLYSFTKETFFNLIFFKVSFNAILSPRLRFITIMYCKIIEINFHYFSVPYDNTVLPIICEGCHFTDTWKAPP